MSTSSSEKKPKPQRRQCPLLDYHHTHLWAWGDDRNDDEVHLCVGKSDPPLALSNTRVSVFYHERPMR